MTLDAFTMVDSSATEKSYASGVTYYQPGIFGEVLKSQSRIVWSIH